MDLLKATSDKLAAAKSMSFTAVVGYEYPSKLGPPLVYSTRYDVTMQRPDKLRILIPGDGPASEYYYDGKTAIAYAPVENLAAVADAPPTIEEALDVFRGLGCTVMEGRLPPLQEWMACGLVILLSEAYAKHAVQIKARPDLYGAAFRSVLSLGAVLGAADKDAAGRKRVELHTAMRASMDDCDLVVSAVQAGTAPKLKDASPWAAFRRPSLAMPFSVTGQPAISICCGYGENGLPLGFQLVAAPSHDRLLLLAGQAYQGATRWHERRPACGHSAPENTAQPAVAD